MISRPGIAFLLAVTACSQVAPPPGSIEPAGSTQPSTTTAVASPSSNAPTPTTTTTTTTRAPALPILPELAEGSTICDLYGDPTTAARVTDLSLVEVSGIAASRSYTGVVWAVNDSGDGPNLYAIDIDGSTISTVTLDGVFPIDWEDLDLGAGPDGEDHLYVGDVGDNLAFRPWVSIFRLKEPDPRAGSVSVGTADELTLAYPDAAGADAEAIAVDPVTGDLIVIPKSKGAVGLYRAALDALVPQELATLERFGTLDLGAEVTAAAFSPSGDRLVLRGYETIWIWLRTSIDLESVLAAAPCEAPSATERQGEALTLLADGTIITISEGGRPPINRIPPVE